MAYKEVSGDSIYIDNNAKTDYNINYFAGLKKDSIIEGNLDVRIPNINSDLSWCVPTLGSKDSTKTAAPIYITVTNNPTIGTIREATLTLSYNSNISEYNITILLMQYINVTCTNATSINPMTITITLSFSENTVNIYRFVGSCELLLTNKVALVDIDYTSNLAGSNIKLTHNISISTGLSSGQINKISKITLSGLFVTSIGYKVTFINPDCLFTI